MHDAQLALSARAAFPGARSRQLPPAALEAHGRRRSARPLQHALGGLHHAGARCLRRRRGNAPPSNARHRARSRHDGRARPLPLPEDADPARAILGEAARAAASRAARPRAPSTPSTSPASIARRRRRSSSRASRSSASTSTPPASRSTTREAGRRAHGAPAASARSTARRSQRRAGRPAARRLRAGAAAVDAPCSAARRQEGRRVNRLRQRRAAGTSTTPTCARTAWCSTATGPTARREFVYRIRATNAGTLLVPPAYAESLYDRDVQARSAGPARSRVERAQVSDVAGASAGGSRCGARARSLLAAGVAPAAPLSRCPSRSRALRRPRSTPRRQAAAPDPGRRRAVPPVDAARGDLAGAGRGGAALRGPLVLLASRRQPGGAAARRLADVRAASGAGRLDLTMQLARRLYDLDIAQPRAASCSRSARALWLEARYGKREILEAYLNLVPYGGNIEGVGAASLVYFGKPPAELTLAEALALAVIPQNPTAAARRARPATRRASETRASAAVRRLARAPQRHRRRRGGARRAARDARAADAAVPRAALRATRCSHGRRRAGRQRDRHDARPALQRMLERQLRTCIARQRRSASRNAAALLVDTRDHGGEGAGRLGRLPDAAHRRPGERRAGQALARLGAQALRLRAGASTRACSTR